MSYKKLKNFGLMSCLGIGIGFMGFLSFEVLFPATPSNAAGTATTELSVDVEPTLEMALDSNTVSLSANGESEILPSSDGVLATGDINVYVTSNSSSYKLTVYSASDTNSMKHVNTNVNASILPTSGGVSELDTDTWGFKYGSASNWTAVGQGESNSSRVATGSATSAICDDIETNYEACEAEGSVNKHTVTFGAKVTDALPSGRYTNNVVFSVVATGGTGN